MIDFWQDAGFAYAVLESKFTSFNKITCGITVIHDRLIRDRDRDSPAQPVLDRL
jgi:hypothetical protein